MKMKTWEYLKQHELAYDEPYWLDLTTLFNDISSPRIKHRGRPPLSSWREKWFRCFTTGVMQ